MGKTVVGRGVIFFEGIIHGVDSNFAVVVAIHSIDVRLLDEENNQK